jgi:DNA-binding transcriptional regulator YhcF (GntR family)
MRFTIENKSVVPIYQQIGDQIARDIALGLLPPGYKLPTVRFLAAENGIAHGTIMHAYGTLEQMGLITRTRGSGTFVCQPKERDEGGAKVQAMQAIDTMLDRLRELSFSPQDIRIFLDLKLREREEGIRNVTVAAVDCSPEALSIMSGQISDLPHTEVYQFLLEKVLETPGPFEPAVDFVVTTPTHYEELCRKMPNGREAIRLVMNIATETALDLAAVSKDARLGIICASRRFSQVILRACEKYCKPDHLIPVAYFGDGDGIAKIIQDCGRLILPSNYPLFATKAEEALIHSREQTHKPIRYYYQVERGSLLHLEEQIDRVYRALIT